MALEEGLDTGPVYARQVVGIDPDESVEELRGRLVELGTSMLVGLLAGGVAGLPVPQPQEGPATYAEKLRPEEFRLDWSQPAEELARVVRLGRAYTEAGGRRLGVLRAAVVERPAGAGDRAVPGQLFGEVVVAGRGALSLVEVQPASARPMAADAWRRGAHLDDGEVLGR
jgi:methionyl-tRNA formyltransferase